MDARIIDNVSRKVVNNDQIIDLGGSDHGVGLTTLDVKYDNRTGISDFFENENPRRGISVSFVYLDSSDSSGFDMRTETN